MPNSTITDVLWSPSLFVHTISPSLASKSFLHDYQNGRERERHAMGLLGTPHHHIALLLSDSVAANGKESLEPKEKKKKEV